jgi:uncharacterized protein YbjT (DUF2867 family)
MQDRLASRSDGITGERGAMRILVTGATGYIGGRLVPALLESGHAVRCLARSPWRLRDVPWRADVEVVAGDVLDADVTRAALEGVDVAYYLVHALTADDFEDRDRRAAETFARAADAAGVLRVVYLGGLAPGGQRLSAHLRSRDEVARTLLAGGVPAIVATIRVLRGRSTRRPATR